MNKPILSLAALLIMVFSAGCYYDSEEEIYPTLECDTGNVTYSGTVLPILTNNCYKCHDAANNFGGVTLEGYSNLKIYAQSGQLLAVIKHQPGFPFMPRNAPQLIECDIAKIETWVLSGAPDN
ncbi:MAG: hypothetical protein ACE5FF_15245 [Saprospiraceae bacterium]